MSRTLSLSAPLALILSAGPAFAAPAFAPHAAAQARRSSPALLKVVRCGIATIGTHYFAGLREAEVREMLEAAEEELPCPPAGAGRDASDRVPEEGYPLYENASALERRLVTTAAQRPIKRITSV
jgi:hypothetical protein